MKRFLMVFGVASILILVLTATAFAARAPQQVAPQASGTPAPAAPTGAPNSGQGSGVQQQGNAACCGATAGRGMGMMGGGMMSSGMATGAMTNGAMRQMQGPMGMAADDMLSMMTGVSPMHDDVEKLLGMNHQDLYNQMASGRSLVQIAAARGITEMQLINGVMAGRKAALDQAVSAGRMTRNQADAMLQYMQNSINTMVNTPGMGLGMGSATGAVLGQMGVSGDDMFSMMAGVSPMHADVEKLLGMTQQDLYSQLASGKSLAQIAAAKGVTESQLIDGIMVGQKAALDQAVASNRITRIQADTMLQTMQTTVRTMVNTPGMGFGMGAGAGAGAGMMWNTQPIQPDQSGQQSQSTNAGANFFGLRLGPFRMHR